MRGAREHLKEACQGDAGAQASERESIAQNIGFLRNHIWKEDNVLFMMAHRFLDSKASGELCAQFEAVRAGVERQHRESAATSMKGPVIRV